MHSIDRDDTRIAAVRKQVLAQRAGDLASLRSRKEDNTRGERACMLMQSCMFAGRWRGLVVT